MSPAAVARRFSDQHEEMIYLHDLIALIRADRARTRRIVRRVMAEEAAGTQYGLAWRDACLTILAALKEATR